ncbi:MAG: hypothetical protein JWP31_1809 [Aeromicrobium sp.]|nr:hypothetical protein [Aeromicrobium sp.]
MTTTDSAIDQLVQQMATDLGIAEPRHSHDPESSMTYCLNIARRHATPYTPKHCNCPTCSLGLHDKHIPAVSR